MPTIDAIIRALISEPVLSTSNPFLLQAEIAAAVLLGIGIIFESDRYPANVREAAFWFVMWGVIFETIFSIGLFASEERISGLQRSKIQEQQAKIISLESCLAARNLSPAQQEHLADRLLPFAGARFDAAIGPRGDPEPLYLLRLIHSTLVRAGWIPGPWTGPGDVLTEPPMPTIGETSVTNVIIDVSPDRWSKFGAAATALANGLTAEGINAIADSQPTTINTDAIHVRIGRKLCWSEPSLK